MPIPNTQPTQPLLLIDDPEWRAAFQQSGERYHPAPIGSLDELSNRLLNSTGCFAVLQITSPKGYFWDRIEFVANQAANPNQACFIGIGDDKLGPLKRELNQVGFSEVWTDYYRTHRIWQLAERHWAGVSWPAQTLEQQIQANLPWS